jgi:hypothetical protein
MELFGRVEPNGRRGDIGAGRPQGQEDAMSLSGFLPAVSRRVVVIGCLAVFACVSAGAPLRAQQTPPAAQPAADSFLFSTQGDNLCVMITLKGAAAGEWESLMKLVQTSLAKSTDPARKQQAAHWKVAKAGPLSDPDHSVMFLWYLDQVVKDKTYNPLLLYMKPACRRIRSSRSSTRSRSRAC